MAQRISVVLSQGQSQNPQKRQLEEDIVTGLMLEPGIDVTVVPHLYDLRPDGTGMLALQGISGDMIVCSWLYERAAHWILSRNKIDGHVGTTLIQPEADDDEEEELEEEADSKDRVINSRDIPNRKIYCLNLRLRDSADDFIEEIRRIAAEVKVKVLGIGNWVNGAPKAEQLARYENPTNDTALAKDGSELQQPAATNGHSSGNGLPIVAEVKRVEEETGRRWYPVIDYSRCTNCMECIDFCLFGVYGVDNLETILVEQPDNCRKGCPACSRVCPENAIMFPQHKTPAIAGSAEAAASLKIDLSLLFGAPESGKSAVEIAALERDEQLLAAGREAVGMSVGIPKRRQEKPDEARDALDDLVDQLDDMDL